MGKKFLVSFASALGCFAAQAAPADANRVIVQTDGGLFEIQGSVALRELGVVQPLEQLRDDTFVLRYSTGVRPIQAARLLRNNPSVLWAQPDYLMSIGPKHEDSKKFSFEGSMLQGIEDIFGADPLMKDLWGMEKIKANLAWALEPKVATKVLVADIDTGVDLEHEDLASVISKVPGFDFANNDSDPSDDQGHGTHTTGTIAAAKNNGVGVAGVTQNAEILAVKFITEQGFGTTSDAVKSIDYAIEKGAKVLSNSWGGPAEDGEENKVLEDAVQRAADADVLFVAAAGNDGTDNDLLPMYPAAIPLPNVLAVASTNTRDTRSFFSNYGVKTVHVGAPGSSIMSTVPGNGYQANSGTSMACPHVAGVAAMVWAANPSLTAVQVKEVVMSTVDKLPALGNLVASGGRVNAKAALEKALAIGGYR
jgi:subtilisin family serine protease